VEQHHEIRSKLLAQSVVTDRLHFLEDVEHALPAHLALATVFGRTDEGGVLRLAVEIDAQRLVALIPDVAGSGPDRCRVARQDAAGTG
jgi:hypothetical protein